MPGPDLDAVWRGRSDVDVEEAVSQLWQYGDQAQEVIRAEARRRRIDSVAASINDVPDGAAAPSPASTTPVRLIDVSKRSSATRWIRLGSRLHIGFCIFFIIQTINFLFREAPELAVLPFGAALISAAIRFGMIRRFIIAGAASVLLFGIPLVGVSIMMALDFRQVDNLLVILVPVVVGLFTIPPFVSLLVDRMRSRGSRAPEDARSASVQSWTFQSWKNFRMMILLFVLAASDQCWGFLPSDCKDSSRFPRLRDTD